jgi:hypothetical protein
MINCRRPGSQRPTTREFKCCSSGCRSAFLELEAAQHLAEALGHCEPVEAFTSAAEDLNRALTAAHSSRYDLQALALEAGWGADVFEKLCRGEITVERLEPDTEPAPTCGHLPRCGSENESRVSKMIQGFQKYPLNCGYPTGPPPRRRVLAPPRNTAAKFCTGYQADEARNGT